jgi:hypothetical protein
MNLIILYLQRSFTYIYLYFCIIMWEKIRKEKKRYKKKKKKTEIKKYKKKRKEMKKKKKIELPCIGTHRCCGLSLRQFFLTLTAVNRLIFSYYMHFEKFYVRIAKYNTFVCLLPIKRRVIICRSVIIIFLDGL